MTSPAFLGALCLALSCLGGAHGFWRSDDLEWSKLIMVHHWPATVCQEVARHCKDPPNYWTIHGLWPDKSEACNRSWPFNPHEIKDLLPDMKMYWPDLLHPSNCSLQFWSHEWKKHGTCAAQLDALNSQRKYFGKSLDLYKALALTSMLQKLGIEPSTDHYYQVSDIRDALVTVYKVVPKVQCFLLEKVRYAVLCHPFCLYQDHPCSLLRACARRGVPRGSVVCVLGGEGRGCVQVYKCVCPCVCVCVL
uniref:Ribonuclease T2 n=1 Tax=Bos indicus x Bos taurus TaxID=30522 RepID=A0A4W2FRV8_BOBOX